MYRVNRVIENLEITKGIFKLRVEGNYRVNPGQFFMVRSWGMEPLLSRPVSVHDSKEGEVSFLYEVRGEGTELLSRLEKGDKIELLGPLGNGFDIEDARGKVAVVSGGLGIAPLSYLIKSLKGCEIDFYGGFKHRAYGLDGIKEYVQNTHISTEGGLEGHRGYITEIFSPLEYDSVFCCGPEVMMKRVVEICSLSDTPVYVSMERHMACGVGACLVCTCKSKEGNKRVCKDGPVFSGREVMMDA